MSSKTNDKPSTLAEKPKQNDELDQKQLDQVTGGTGAHGAGGGGGAGKTTGGGLIPAV
jgi:hypothetical protein